MMLVPKKFYCISTHGIFPTDPVDRLYNSGLFRKIAVSNSHPSALQAQERFPDFIEILPLEPLFQRLYFVILSKIIKRKRSIQMKALLLIDLQNDFLKTVLLLFLKVMPRS